MCRLTIYPRSRLAANIFIIHAVLLITWLLLFRYCQRTSYHDPSSFFYRREEAYQPYLSATRQFEADEYLLTLDTGDYPFPNARAKSYMNKGGSIKDSSYCLGIPSLRRHRHRFLARTLASLVDSLSPEQRDMIHIVVLISDEDATLHDAFGKPWLSALADEVLVHESADGDKEATATMDALGYQKLSSLPGYVSRNERVRRDYASLVEICGERHAEHFILMEDDVIASRDWFLRLHEALSKIRIDASRQNWLYLRLFYSETFLGWNSEEWPLYIRNILAVYALVIGSVWLIRRQARRPSAPSIWASSSRDARLSLASILVFWLPMFTLLYFMAGRLLVNPYRPGVREMPKYGCCSQGLVFPAAHIDLLQEKLLERPYKLAADALIEEIAEGEALEKLALVPSVLQHVGARESSAKGGKSKKTWNFSFERQNL